MRLIFLPASLIALTILGSMADAQAPPPNIVLVLTDDQAWNGTSVQMHPDLPNSKSDFYQTPRLEELAAAGMRFSDGYASAPICSSTRAAIQTGKSPAQLQLTDLPWALPPSYDPTSRWQGGYTDLPLTPPAPFVFDPTQDTLPRIIKDANPNYVTAHFDKWHLDLPTTTTPQAAGYDVGTTLGGYDGSVDPKGVFLTANTVNSFMQDRVNNNQPFFVQVSYKAVHDPVQARAETVAKYEALPPGIIHKNVNYAAMTEDLDTSFGSILDKIDQLGITDNTYVIFVSDNGAPVQLSSSAPLRGSKATVWEGGIRVPFIVRGPGVEPGSVSRVPVTTTDLYSTIAQLAGHVGPLPEDVEGASMVPLLENGGELPEGMDHLARNHHEGGEVIFHFPMNVGWNFGIRPQSSIRDGDFKLHVQYGENGNPDEYSLSNLATNIGETNNLASSMPEKVAELRAKMDRYFESIDASFAYDVKQDVVMQWDASQPGSEANRWRSSIDLRVKSREIWDLGTGSAKPQRQMIATHQPGLPNHAFTFDGNDALYRVFFQVGDDEPRRATLPDSGTADFDRSASMEFWIRLDSLAQEQVLFESGGADDGISATLGDADSDGKTNDLRFRIRGRAGADGGVSPGTLRDITVTTPIDRFADPKGDFIHIVTVFNDDPGNRYGEVYVNGALAARVNGLTGLGESINWDGFDKAGLGNTGDAVGGSGGTGDLPFLGGGFRGQMSLVRFYNHTLNSSAIQDSYNSALYPTDYGINSVTGQASVPVSRPTNVSLHSQESSSLLVVQERSDILVNPLEVDSLVTGPLTLNALGGGTTGSLAAGTSFTSYLLQFDPAGSNPAVTESVTGSVVFSEEIVAVLFDAATLAGSDALLGAIGNYGLETDRGLLLTGSDLLSISSNRHTLNFALGIPGDEQLQFRVLTGLVVPEPSADFNGDGLVNSADLAIWEAAYGISDSADANYDDQSTGLDFLAWQRQTQAGNPLAVSKAVPEPASWLIGLTLVFGMSAVRRVSVAD